MSVDYEAYPAFTDVGMSLESKSNTTAPDENVMEMHEVIFPAKRVANILKTQTMDFLAHFLKKSSTLMKNTMSQELDGSNENGDDRTASCTITFHLNWYQGLGLPVKRKFGNQEKFLMI